MLPARLRRVVLPGATAVIALSLCAGPAGAGAPPGNADAAPAATPSWVATYDAAGGIDTAVDVAVDPATGISVVTGQTEPAGGGIVITTVAYDRAGAQMWVRSVPGTPDYFSAAAAVRIDSARATAYVVGTVGGVDGIGDQDGVVAAYGLDGTTRWITTYDVAGRNESFRTLEVDGATGRVAVAGNSRADDGRSGSDLRTLTLDPTGAIRWERRDGSPGRGSDSAEDLALGPDGSVYVTGSTGVGDGIDGITLGLSPAGDLLWSRRTGALGLNVDVLLAVAVSADGSTVYVTGRSDGRGIVAAFGAPGGARQWEARADDPAPALSGFGELALGADGTVYVAGTEDGDVLTEAYTPDGTRRWSTRLADPADREDNVVALGLDRGRLVVTVRRIQVAQTGVSDIVVATFTDGGVPTNLRRYTPSGPGGNEVPVAAVIDPTTRRLIVTGNIGVSPDADYLTIAAPLT